MHWADVEASKLRERGPPHRIATGITPSGHIHVGNMREILTGDAVHRALTERGGDSKLLYVADTFDPLRKVYPFLPDHYESYIGQPISEIPCPCGEHESYAEHFLEPFLKAVEELGINIQVKHVHRMYAEGGYSQVIRKVIAEREKTRAILEEVTGRELKDDWFPYTPKCSRCNTFADTVVKDFTDPLVHYECSCGNRGTADIGSDDGKLPWRIEWPARWSFLDISCEPFGKDHAAAGGSYESGKRIIEEILGGRAPHPVVYEWIQLKGKGAMSSSKGVVITAVDMLKMTPPEVLRFLIMRVDPPKHIDFDSGFGILNLVDEYDRYEEIYFGLREEEGDTADKNRIFELSQADPDALGNAEPAQTVSYRHLVSLVQIDPSVEEVLERVKRTEGMEELSEREIDLLRKRAECAKYWVENYAPEAVRFSILGEFDPATVDGFGETQREIAGELLGEFRSISWEAKEIHQACYRVKERVDTSPMKVFSLVYKLLLGQKRGPRLGYFLSSLDRDLITGRLEEGLKAMKS